MYCYVTVYSIVDTDPLALWILAYCIYFLSFFLSPILLCLDDMATTVFLLLFLSFSAMIEQYCLFSLSSLPLPTYLLHISDTTIDL